MVLAYESIKQNTLAITAFEKVIALESPGKTPDTARKAIRRIHGQ
jgi:hypothetical protein